MEQHWIKIGHDTYVYANIPQKVEEKIGFFKFYMKWSRNWIPSVITYAI